MAKLQRNQRARKTYRCDGRGYGDCTHWIRAGEMYQRSALPPINDVNPGHWVVGALCAPCAAYYQHPIEKEPSHA